MLRIAAGFACFAFALLGASAVNAGERDGPPDGPPGEEKSYSWGLGVGALTQQQAYTGIDRNNFAIPLIYFENRWVQLMGPNLDFKLPDIKWSEEQKLSYGVGVQLFGGFGGYEPDDAPILNGMEERKNGLLAGPFAKWSNPFFDVSVKWMYDVSGESKGQNMSLGLERNFFVGQHFMITPGVTATWLDKKYADYYYGVRRAEARVGRPAYVADSTLNTEISLRTDYLFDQHQALFLMLGYTALGSEIKDSPLTDDSGETMAFLGYLYRF